MDSVKNKLFAKMQATGRGNEITYRFKMANNDEARVSVALSTMKMFDIVPQARCRVKNSKASIDFRNEANRIFVTCKNNVEELLKAWELYSESIATAPNVSEELSLSYANRSALLMKFHKYSESIQDINRALSLNYPKNLKSKILCRKVECLKLLNKSNHMKDALEEVTSCLKSVNFDNGDLDKLADMFKKIESSILYPEAKKVIHSLKLENPCAKIPCASEAIAVKYDENFGRHVVATRKIEPGEFLVIEKPYATILKPEEIYTHCSHCLQLHWSMIPCEFCTYAMYCSDECKNDAWKKYHDLECPVTGYLLDMDYNKCSLFSMRLAILALKESGNVNKLKDYLNKLDNCPDAESKGFSEDGIYRSDKYCSLYSLVTNVEKRSVSDLFERALNAAFITYYLCTQTELFGKKFDPDLQKIVMDKDVLFIGGLILRHMQIIPSNIHSYEEERNMDAVDIGASALPFCSLINHSCDPNVSRCSTRENMIIFSLVTIEKGAQIFDSYGSHYAVMSRQQRIDKLKQYNFTCACTACKEDWPTYENLPSYQKLLRDEKIKRKVEKALDKFDSYVDYATRGEIDDKPELKKDLSTMINILIQSVPLPCCEVNNVVETLKRVFSLTYGNKFEVPKTN